MISTSAKWKTFSQDSSIFRPSGTLVGQTTLLLDADDFMMGTLSFTDSISDPGMVTLGGVISNSVSFTLNNTTGKFDSFDFKGAELALEFTAEFSDGTSETIQRGIYTLERPKTMGYTIQLTGYDFMDKLNKYFLNDIGGSDITYPIAAKTLIEGLCTNCGVSYDFSNWSLANPNIEEFEYDESCTQRQVISWVLQTLGGYARINNIGEMECKPFNIETNPANIYAVSKIKNQTVGLDDITVTGVRAFAYNTVDEFDFDTAGSGGYILSITDNPLITANNMTAVATQAWNAINGLRFHSFEANVFGDPSYEAGDTVTITDYLSNTYTTLITDMTYQIGSQRLTCDCETPEENALETVNPTTQTIMGATQAAYDYVKAKKISADYVSAGTLTGAVIAKNLTMEGGSIDIETSSATTDHINLDYYDDNTGLYERTGVRSGGFQLQGQNPKTFNPGDSYKRAGVGMVGDADPGGNPHASLYVTTDDSGTASTLFEVNTVSNGTITIRDNPLADFVISEGSSGNWTWRKWYNGDLEYWYRETKSNVAITSSSGAGYYATITNGLSYPTAFKNGTYPVVQWTVQCADGYGWVAPAYNYTNAYTGGAYIYSFSSVTKSFTYNIYAKGRWK